MRAIKSRLIPTLLSTGLAVLFATAINIGDSAAAAEREGIHLPDSIIVEGQELLLNGLGTRRATIFKVRVYVAGLYLKERTSDPSHIITSTSPKKLVLHFLRDVDNDDVMEAWEEGLTNNNPNGAELLQKLYTLIRGVGDISAGTELSLTFNPSGVTLDSLALHNSVEDSELSAAILRIWLGDHPPEERLKKGLLGVK
jgi:hypothetical protein